MEKKRRKRGGGRKATAVSFALYGIWMVLFFVPWITAGNHRYNLFKLALDMKKKGLEGLLSGAGALEAFADMEQFGSLEAGIWAELFLFGVCLVLGVLYVTFILMGKRRQINKGVTVLSFTVFVLHVSGVSIMAICENAAGAMFPVLFPVLSGTELIFRNVSSIWEQTKAEANASQERTRMEKEERQERLSFEGRYNELFYRFVWKNFKSNWKDYILLLLSSIFVFTFIITGFGLSRILGAKSRYEGMDQLFGGLNAVLMNAIIPLGIISVIIIVILTLYYLKCRAKNYGIFITLGMRMATLKYFVAVEFLSLLFITLVAGGILGTGVLALFSAKSELFVGTHIGLSAVGIRTYLYSAAALLLIYLVAFMATRDIFYDFNIGRSTDLNAVRERMPVRFCKGLPVFGAFVCLISVWRYGQLKNFESVYLLLLLFIGTYLVLRYGMAGWLKGERKKEEYLKKLMAHNQLYHKSKTNTRYVFAMAAVQFCALFYFSFQVISTVTAEDGETLYPYDAVCMANDEDEDIFRRIEEKYDVTRTEYPMVRISNYDSTERMEGASDQTIQGQHIGISESTYHALKAELDPDYREESLHLDAEGEEIYIVHQQDKSVKAQPLDFHLSRKHPLLHTGPPCPYVSAMFANVEDVGYYFKNIKGEEIGSLTGTFRQGLRDNLVVFSDTYFEKARELWKTTDMSTGEPIPEDEEKIPGVNIRQGPSRLILLRAKEDAVPGIESELAKFKERHREDESYDRTVSCCYTKPEALRKLKTERVMKITMNFLVMMISLFVYLVLLGVKMATESGMAARRTEFLICMGMCRKERRALIRRELLRYCYLVPTVIAAGLAGIFTAAVFLARQYTMADCLGYLKGMVPMWAVCLGAVGILVFGMVERYVRKAEGKGERDGKRN